MSNQEVVEEVRWAVRGAVFDAVHRAVVGAERGATDWAVWRVVYDAAGEAVIDAVNGAMWQDPAHPAFQDFLGGTRS